MHQRFAILLSAGALAITVACSQTDAGITSAVKSKMAFDDRVKASEINVDTHNHVVTLNGTVASTGEKERAEMIARNTTGVTSVVNDLAVGPSPAATSGRYDDQQKATDTTRDTKAKTEGTAHEAKVKTEKAASKTGEVITDAAITTDVKTKLAAEPGVSALDVHVDTNNHVVTLNGTVKSKAESQKAMAIARDTKGVKRVVNHLKVAA
jgi:hyperosmotically inducible periplasmic protein